jgi:outer membrane receptor for ferrienterochelin and colicins
VLVALGGQAHAEDRAPAIPVRELPPFPDVVVEAADVSEVGMFGAALTDEETVSGAAKREQSLGTVASAVTVITADQIRRYAYRTLAEALRGVAGVYLVDDRMVERIGIRGFQQLGDANTRVLILIDGTPFNEPWSQFVDGSTALPVSLDDVARIEVIRGPVSSIYGTNAFVGIINIVTIEADKAPGAYGRTSVDSDGTFGGNAAFATGHIDRQVRGTFAYQDRAGETVHYPDLDGTGLMATSSADGARALAGSLSATHDRLFFQARAYQRRRELTGAPYESDLGSPDNVDRHRHLVAELGYTRELSRRVTLAARVYGNRYAYASRLAYAAHPDPARPAAFVSDATSLWYGGELRALADVLPRPGLLGFIVGAAVESTRTESTASTRPEPIVTDFAITGAYLEATSEPTRWFALTAGARLDRNSEFTNEVSPRAAAFLRRGDDYGVKLLFAKGFRNPSILEAYYEDDLRFAPVFDAEGRTQLRPESITAYEVVAYGRLATGIKARVSAWDWRLEDVITRDLVFVVDERRLRYQNEAAIISRGLEVEGTYRDVAGRSAYGSVAYAVTGANCLGQVGVLTNPLLDRAVRRGNCDAQENAPSLVAKLGLSSQRLLARFHLSTELSYLSSRLAQDRRTPIDPHLGWNLVAYAPDLRGLDVTVGLRNLLGREPVPAQVDYNRTDPNVDVLRVPGPGREVFARVGYRFR